VRAVVNYHDLPRCDRFQDALPSEDCGECLCGADLSACNGPIDCSACKVTICEDCALKGECRHDACENVYCDKCAAGFLPAEDAGFCVPCVNEFMRVPAAQFFRGLGRTG